MKPESGWGQVGLRPLTALLPHEETIPFHVQRVSEELRRDGLQRDPLIVDRERGVVLDGMHRLAAMSLIGLEYAVCCSVDYSSAGIAVRRWARVYTAESSRLFTVSLDKVGLSTKCSSTEALDSLERRNRVVASIMQSGCRVSDEGISLAEGFEIVRKFDEYSVSNGWRREFVPEDEIDIPLQDSNRLVLLVSRLRKQDVVLAGTSGSLFPCKTSMHVIDPRPVGVDIPLDDLKDGSRRTLEMRLRSDHTFLPANTEYGGRRYKERLVVLSDD